MSDIHASPERDQPAFPVADEVGTFHGLTKREYFAALAMQGLLSQSSEDGGQFAFSFVTHQAIHQADDLIAELNK
jgi:hypothetical protein